MVSMIANMDQGDPQATPKALLAVVDMEAPPLRFFLGSTGLPRVRDAYKSRLELWQEWAELSESAQGHATKGIVSL